MSTASIVLGDLIVLAIPITYFFLKHKDTGKRLTLKKARKLFFLEGQPPKKILFESFVLLCVLMAVSVGLSLALDFAGLSDPQKSAEEVRQLIQTAPLGLLWLSTVTPAVEEAFYRAFLVPRIGVFPSALVFGAVHFPYGSIGYVVVTIALGCILGHWLKRTKSLVPNIVGHALFNALNALLFL